MDNLTITKSGRFQGEPRWVPHFYNLAMNSDGEMSTPGCEHDENENCDCTLMWYFQPDVSECEKYPELEAIDDIWLWETNDGFVIHMTDRDAVAAYWNIDRRAVVPCNVG